MKLISMTDFVFLMRENKEKDNIRRFWACEKYAQFLKQPLTLGMFVPCDEDGNVLEEPFNYSDYLLSNVAFGKINRVHSNEWFLECDQYQKAKERVLFDWFDVPKDRSEEYRFRQWLKVMCNVESLIGVNRLELTPYALKHIEL